MSVKYNSKTIFICAACVAFSAGGSSLNANTFNSALSDNTSSGSILLAQDDLLDMDEPDFGGGDVTSSEDSVSSTTEGTPNTDQAQA